MKSGSEKERPASTTSGFVYIAIGLVALAIGVAFAAMRPMGLSIWS